MRTERLAGGTCRTTDRNALRETAPLGDVGLDHVERAGGEGVRKRLRVSDVLAAGERRAYALPQLQPCRPWLIHAQRLLQPGERKAIEFGREGKRLFQRPALIGVGGEQ